MKNCEYYQKMISDFHDDGTELSQEVKEHLKSCDSCADYYSLLDTQMKLLRELPDSSIQTSGEGKKSILKKVWEFKLSIPLPAAAVILFLLISMYFLRGTSQTQLQTTAQEKQINPGTQNIQIVKLTPQKAFIAQN